MSSPAAQRRQAHVTIARDHPAFAGHFPGAPVLPGVVLLSLVIEAVAADTTLGVDASGALQWAPARPAGR